METTSRSHDACELLEEVKQALAPVLSGKEVRADEDGDIPVGFGEGTVVYVRVLPGIEAVRLFSVVSHLEEAPSGLLAELNVINAKLLFARVLWDGRAVVLAAELPARPLVASDLQMMLAMVGTAASEIRGELRLRYAPGQRELRPVPRAPEPPRTLAVPAVPAGHAGPAVGMYL